MTSFVIILLKTLVVLLFARIMYVLWQVYMQLKWNRLLYNKQKEQDHIELLQVNYVPRLSGLVVVMVILIMVINTPANTIDTISNFSLAMHDEEPLTATVEEQIAELMGNIEQNDGDVYIIEVNALNNIENYNILYNTVDDALVDYYNYDVDVVEVLYGTSFSVSNESLILSENYVTNVQVTSTEVYKTYTASTLEDNAVYLVIGGYVTSTTNTYSDVRLDDQEFIFTWEAILLEGYDVTKSLEEQSQSIQDIVYEYTQHLNE
jgi:hypothetical protein